jgi:hypothetical protein
LAEKAFLGGTGQASRGYPGIVGSEFLYSPECKLEVPAQDGEYTAYLVEGGQPVSEPFTFTVSGRNSRLAIVEWREK